MAVTEVTYNAFNVTAAESAATLIPVEQGRGGIGSISICNQHATDTAVVTLILDDVIGSTNSIHIINIVSIPAGVTLMLDGNVSFDNSIHELKITNTGGIPLSVIAR